MEIKKGKWYKCVKTEKFLSKTLFIKGKVYIAEEDDFVTDEYGVGRLRYGNFKPYRKNKRWGRGRKL